MSDPINEFGGNAGVLHNNWQSASGSMSSSVSDHGTLESKNLLEEQYILLRKSFTKDKKKNVYCCANEKTRPWLMRTSFLIVIALGLIVSYFEVRFSTYSSKSLILNTGDQLLLPLSTYFNRQVKFYATSDERDYLKLYVLKHMPNISSEIVKYRSGVEFHMPSWTYQYWGFRLLTGTSVRISICTDLQIQFYIIRGVKKLEKWTQQILYNGYDYHKNIFPKPSCKRKSDFTTHDLRIDSSDIYYILFSSSAGWRFYTSVSVLMQFNRTYYDVSNAKYACPLSNKTCSSYLDNASTDISLLETILPNEEGIHSFHRINVRYVPVPRHEFYYKLFGAIYLTVFTISVIYIAWRTFINHTYSHNEKKPLLSNNLPQGYCTTNPGDKKWVVVSKLPTEEVLCRIEEREDASLLGVDSNKSLAIDSINSREFMNYHREAANYAYRNEYNNSQQLLDACLASAGASAI